MEARARAGMLSHGGRQMRTNCRAAGRSGHANESADGREYRREIRERKKRGEVILERGSLVRPSEVSLEFGVQRTPVIPPALLCFAERRSMFASTLLCQRSQMLLTEPPAIQPQLR